MTNEPKENGADADGERKRRNTPVIVPAAIEDLLGRITRVRLRLRESRGLHDRTDQLLEEVERLVRQPGSDDQVRDLYLRLSLHFQGIEEFVRDDVANIMGGLGRAFRRRAEEIPQSTERTVK